MSWVTVRRSGFVLRGLAMQAAGEGMVMESTKRDVLTDERCVKIIEGIKACLPANKLKSGAITGIGPVKPATGGGWTCQMNVRGGKTTLKDADSDAEIVKKALEAIDEQKQEVHVRPGLGKLPGHKASMNPRPYRHGGPIMGGDPIWHNKAAHWGTIAFAIGSGDKKVKIAGHECAGQLVTANHVVDFGTEKKAVSVTDYINTMTVTWQEPAQKSGDCWIDLAAVKVEDSLAKLGHVPISALEVRGLGRIEGVEQARRGHRVYKYGATTALTVGIDLGPALRDLDEGDENQKMHWVRVVSGHFADNGDSGAAVLDSDRNLVGIVVSGKPSFEDETYYIQALKLGVKPALPVMSTFTVDGINVN